ncbi:MAG: hypothetical protein JXA25_16540 [Anaerolineales bacterium]|nr:hypothetical protein [Anaerolineales bacterium]
MTIRPFNWQDVPLLIRLRNDGICLESRLGLTKGPSTFNYLLQDAFAPGGRAVTLVARSEENIDGFGQLLHRPGEPLASLVYLAPEDIFQQSALIEALGVAAGERGAFNMVASISESHPGFEALRNADFHIYARQAIWCIQRPSPAETNESSRWKPRRPKDRDAVQGLYLNLVPALVQQVETLPDKDLFGLVYWDGGDLLGAVLLDHGPIGTWAQILLHPAAEQIPELIEEFLAEAAPDSQPLYVVVRSYQSWIEPVLEQLGFKALHHQAVMVKRLAVGLHKPAMNNLPVMDTARPEVSASITEWEQNRP